MMKALLLDQVRDCLRLEEGPVRSCLQRLGARASAPPLTEADRREAELLLRQLRQSSERHELLLRNLLGKLEHLDGLEER